ncbi:MAG TPA: hypothetical protein VGE77_10315 [Nocardioides sp.]
MRSNARGVAAAAVALVLGATAACGGSEDGSEDGAGGAAEEGGSGTESAPASRGTQICDLLPAVARDWEAADPQETLLLSQEQFVGCAVDPGGLLEVGVRVEDLGWVPPSIDAHLPPYAADGRQPVADLGEEAYRTLETAGSGSLENLVARDGDVTVLVRNATSYAADAPPLDTAATEEIARALLGAVTPAMLDEIELVGPDAGCPGVEDTAVVELIGEVAGMRGYVAPTGARCSYRNADGGSLVISGLAAPSTAGYLRGDELVDVAGADEARLDEQAYPGLTVDVDGSRVLVLTPVPPEDGGASAAEAPDLLVGLAEQVIADGLLDGLET